MTSVLLAININYHLSHNTCINHCVILLQDLLDGPGHLDQMVSLEDLVFLVPLDQLDLPDQEAFLVALDFRVDRAGLVLLVPLDHKVSQVNLEGQVLLDLLDCLDHPDHKVLQVQWYTDIKLIF